MGEFRLVSQLRNYGTLSYTYTCCDAPVVSCQFINTQPSSWGNGNINMLDRQSVQCNDGQLLQGFHLQSQYAEHHTVNYGYTCCQLDCASTLGIFGAWQPSEYSNGQQEISITYGTTHSYTATDSTHWGVKVGASVEAGFSAFGASGKMNISAEASYDVAHPYSETFQMSHTSTYRTSFQETGQIW